MLDRVFVYGSLRPASPHPMSEWLARRGQLLGGAWLRGYLYMLPTYPALVADPDGPPVHGELYRLRHPARLLRELDRYEGCVPGQRQPFEFVRRRLWVQRPEAAQTEAWVYLYNRPVRSARCIASGDYLEKNPVRNRSRVPR